MQKYISRSEDETKNIAAELAKMVRQTHHKNNIFALTGELGAGKTIFAQGFAKGLRIKEKIISPTFVLIRQHKIPKSPKMLYHIDLYRLENIKDILHLGIKEILANPNNIVLIEWAEKIQKLLSKSTVWISIKVIKENIRQISIKTGYIESL